MRIDSWKPRVAVVAAALVTGAAAVCIGPARAAVEALQTCAQSSPCLFWQNTNVSIA